MTRPIVLCQLILVGLVENEFVKAFKFSRTNNECIILDRLSFGFGYNDV